jgi:hypothetical protein
MTEDQANDLIDAVNGVRSDLALVRGDLALLRSDVQYYQQFELGSTYALTTTAGAQDLRIEATFTLGELTVSLLLLSLLAVLAVKFLFGALRGVAL